MFFMQLLLPFLFFILGGTQNTSNITRIGIFDGNDTDIRDAPYQASLHMDNQFIGGAVIVTDRHVITLGTFGWILINRTRYIAHILAGSNEVDSGDVHLVKSVALHPSYVYPSNDYNIAVLELLKPLEFSDRIKPIKIAKNPPEEGVVGFVTGWGLTKKSSTYSKTLKGAETSFKCWYDCAEDYKKFLHVLTDRMICTSERLSTVCNGDQGGPIVVGNHLVGIASDWYSCGRFQLADVFVNVANGIVSGHLAKVAEKTCCQDLIVGGDVIDINKVPYQAGLILKNQYFCGASIISETFAITAAHCIVFFFQRSAHEHIYLRAGSNNTDKNGVLVPVKNSICHPKFNMDTYDYDICIIELSKSLNFSQSIQPIEIANVEPEGGEIGRIAGWGTLSENGKSPDTLQSVWISVTNKTYCKEAYEKISPVTDRMFCAGTEGKDSCQGDSGGGLVVDGRLMGVISTGFGCGAKNFPGVYTSIGHPDIRKYIMEVANV
ncbi:hypothetical protein RUM44_011917 [Polyplax serrata]|uniref:Peptidase S1 domain-containing protein n=1 Tax=Polyplax serrata TaxID=468196 RepID=A0ABR1B9V5_POLSC